MHVGHISFALKALEICKLDKILLLPERYPRGKEQVADIDARVRHIRQLTSDYPEIEIVILNTMPITVQSEKQELEHIFLKNDVVLLLGSDTLQKLKHWQDINLLLKDHELCVGIRGDDTKETVVEHILALEHELEVNITYHTVTTVHKDISSTSIRASQDYTPL